ncbi:MAG TPA: VTT domain-containing protein [Usitatibacter sp.]|nr:VTT domain-containing protein [Usitatibacter sp.]
MYARHLVSNRLLQLIFAGIMLTLVLAAVWKFTPLKQAVDLAAAVDWVEEFSHQWWAPLAILLAFTPASFVMFPRQVLSVAAAIAFGPIKGWLLSVTGVVIAALVGWRIGRQLNEHRVRRWAGESFAPTANLLRSRGLVAVMAVRALPVAPFTIESIVAGALRIKWSDLVLGTVFGMAPGMLGTSFIGDQLGAAMTMGRHVNVWIVAGAAAWTCAVAIGARWWIKRLKRLHAI